MLLALALAAAVALLCAAAPYYQYSIWADRDFVRADVGWGDLPVTGTEMNGTFGARTPGGAYYILLHLLLATGGGPAAVRMGMIALLLVCAAAIAFQAVRLWGWRAALVAAALPLTVPTFINQFRVLWNPSFSMSLDGLVCVGLLALTRGRRYGAALLAVSLAVAVQVHLSALALGVAALVAAIPCARGVTWRQGLVAAVLGLALFLPYALHDGAQGWQDFRAILHGDGLSRGAIRWGEMAHLVILVLGSPEVAIGPLVPAGWLWAVRTVAAVAAVAVGLGLGWRLLRTGANPLRWRAVLRDASDRERATVAVAITVFLTPLLLAAVLGERFSMMAPRYAIALLWPVALAAGWGADGLMRRTALLPALAISAWLVAAAVESRLVIHNQSWDTPERRAVLAVASEMVPPEQVSRRVVVLGEDGKAHQVYARFWLRHMAPPSAADDGACVAVLPSGDERAGQAAFAGLMATAAGGPAEILWQRRLGDGWAIGYRLPYGNCWRSTDSPYDLYPAEESAGRVCRSAESDAPLPVPGEAGHFAAQLTFGRMRLCLSLMAAPSAAGGTAVELNAAQLRGYSGYPTQYYVLAHPRLQFRDASGATVAELPLVDGGIGGINLPLTRGVEHDGNPARPPWRVTVPVGLDAVSTLHLVGAFTSQGQSHAVDVAINLRP